MRTTVKILFFGCIAVVELYCFSHFLLPYFRQLMQNNMYLNDEPSFWYLTELFALVYIVGANVLLARSARLSRRMIALPLLLLAFMSFLIPIAYIITDFWLHDGADRPHTLLLKLSWGSYAILASFYAHGFLLGLLGLAIAGQNYLRQPVVARP